VLFRLGFASAHLFASALILFAQDVDIPFFEPVQILPASFVKFDGDSNGPFYLLLTVAFVASRILWDGRDIADQVNRFCWCAKDGGLAVACLTGFLGLAQFIPRIDAFAPSKVTSLGLVTLLTLVIDADHRTADLGIHDPGAPLNSSDQLSPVPEGEPVPMESDSSE
jgi:hypothetical protein